MPARKETEESLWKRRYAIAAHAFFVYLLLNSHRIIMGVAIVSIVDVPDHANHIIQLNSNTTEMSNSAEILNEDSADKHVRRYNWSPKVQGCILGASFFGYVLVSIMGGALAETFGPRAMLLIGTFISSFSTLVTPFTAIVSPYLFMFVQCVRGVAQGFMFPAVTVLSANWYPNTERGLLSSLALAGYFFGLLIGGFASSLICDTMSIGGWPTAFYTFGGFGILLSIFQLFSLYSLPEDDPRISSAELKYILENQENKLEKKRPPVPWSKILCSVSTYALLFAMFGQFWLGYHFLSIHPTFLATVLHYPLPQIGTLVSAPYVLAVFLNVSSSFLSSYLKTKKYLSLNQIRKFWNLCVSVIYSLCLILMIFTKSESTVTVIASVLVIGSMGLVNSGIMIVALEMTPTFAGSLMGLGTTVASLSGFIVPVVSGVLTNDEQSVKQWNKFFIISIVLVMTSAIFFCIFGSAEIQSYNDSGKDLSAKNEKRTTNTTINALKDTTECTNHM